MPLHTRHTLYSDLLNYDSQEGRGAVRPFQTQLVLPPQISGIASRIKSYFDIECDEAQLKDKIKHHFNYELDAEPSKTI